MNTTLLIDALIIGAIASIVLGICFYFTRWIGCISVLCIIIGALTGTWVSFGARKFEIEFEDLASLEKDKMTPVIRLIYIAVALLFGSQEKENGQSDDLVQKYRDILKFAVVMQEDEVAYILLGIELGIENQTDIHYAM